MLFVEKQHNMDVKKNSSIATNFDERKLIITNLTSMPLKKKLV
jgi:hypothetical protein